MKKWFTHLLDRSQATSGLERKLFLVLMNQKFQFMIFILANDHVIYLTLIFILPDKMFQMNNCAKLFWNPCINVQVMAQTSSIYDHFNMWPSSVTLTFNLPEQTFHFYSSRTSTVPNNFEIHAQMYKVWSDKSGLKHTHKACTYTELKLKQLCLAHHKRAWQKSWISFHIHDFQLKAGNLKELINLICCYLISCSNYIVFIKTQNA